MNNVLLVGNGFDLAHGLLTKYEHFLEVIKNWEEIYPKLLYRKRENWISREYIFYKYIRYAPKMNEDNLVEFDRIIKNNSWVNYFKECEAEIDGWIDFEREINPVINVFEKVFKVEFYNISKGANGGLEAYFGKDYFYSKQIRIIKMWDKYLGMNDNDNDIVYVKEPYVSKQYGILKKEILKSLRKEFDEFIKAFEIYLLEFVSKITLTDFFHQIRNIRANYVISFNYTYTENLYGITDNRVHHIHGSVRQDFKSKKIIWLWD